MAKRQEQNALIIPFTEDDMANGESLGSFLKEVHKSFLDELRSNYLPEISKSMGVTKTSFKVLKRTRVSINKKMITEFDHKLNGRQDENFAEVINQMATVEGMLFALERWQDDEVILAHPTHTSFQKDFDHDLVLRDFSNGKKRYVEISDVVGQKDSNGKFLKDLNSLYQSYLLVKKIPNYKTKHNFYILTSSEVWNYHSQRPVKLKSKLTLPLSCSKGSLRFPSKSHPANYEVTLKVEEKSDSLYVVMLKVVFN